MALFGHDMDQARAFRHVADILQHRDQRIEIVAIDRPDIVEAQLLEQGAAHRHAARELVGLVRGIVQRGGQFPRKAPGEIAQLEERARGDQPREIGRQPAHRRGNRHVVVVEDDDEAIARNARIVHRLIGHARRHRPVADHRNAAARLARQFGRNGKAQRGGNRGGAVRRAERIVEAFRALGEARQPAFAAKCECGRAARSGSCADRPDGRHPRPACRSAYRRHNAPPPSARPPPARPPDAPPSPTPPTPSRRAIHPPMRAAAKAQGGEGRQVWEPCPAGGWWAWRGSVRSWGAGFTRAEQYCR